MNIVPCFGIHRDHDDVAWLVQGSGTSNSIGLKSQSPFKVEGPDFRRRENRCNHFVDLNEPEPPPSIMTKVMSMMHDPLFKAMLPLPQKREAVIFVSESVKDVLLDLARMTNPSRSIVNPVWSVSQLSTLYEALQITNIQPLILTNVDLLDMPLLRQITPHQSQLPRQLVIASIIPEMIVPAGMIKIKTKLKAHPEWPWERIGASFIRKYMRGEQI